MRKESLLFFPLLYIDIMSKSLRIREVKDLLPKIPLPREVDPRLPYPIGVMLLIMKVKSGKSNLLCNYLLSEHFLGGKDYIYDTIYIISPTAKIDKSSQAYSREEFKERIIIFDDLENIDPFLEDILKYQQTFDIHDEDNLPPRTALVFDDISGYLRRNSLVTHIFTRYRHFNLSLFCANQTCRDLPTAVRSQATSVWLSSCYSNLERKKIIEEWGEFFQNNLELAWDWACKERFNYLMIRLDDVEPRLFRIGKDPMVEIDYKNIDSLYEDELMIDIIGGGQPMDEDMEIKPDDDI